MAIKKVTLKRYNGVDIDDLFPTTTLDQIISEGTGAGGTDESLSSYLDNRFINIDQRAAANGVATLDENAKLKPGQLPNYVFTGGIESRGVVNLSSGKTVDDIMDTEGGSTVNKLTTPGDYLQVSSTGVFEQGSTWTGTILPPGDEGDFLFPVTLESGDWITVNEVNYSNNTVTFAIVNNTYKYASTTERGVVRLMDAANTSELTNNSMDVITENFMFDNLAEGELNGGASGANNILNKLAGSNHIHDGRYFTEAEIDDFFAGTTAITGYNKSDWDSAFDKRVDSLSFVGNAEANNGVLTITRQDNTTLTVNLQNDYRYYTKALINGWIDGTNTINGDTYTPVVYGENPTSTITGAILIDLD